MDATLTQLDQMRSAIDIALDQYTQLEDGFPQRLCDAVRHSVLAPGKRLRPVLALLACESISGTWQPAIPVACAVEFVHVYSLIHDDLPSMDNDDLRRGRPTCHRQFDEATAILAGDCLQMLAIEVICRDMPMELVATCCQILSRSAGRCMLVGGQIDDLAAEGRFQSERESARLANPVEYLKSIHRRKTGALIEASVRLGGVAAGGTDEQLECLSHFGRAIGLAFQIVDDCLDVESTTEQLGKNTRKDKALGKLTYPGLLGLEDSRKLADDLVREAQSAIAVLGSRGHSLCDLAQFVVDRSK